MPQIKNTWNSFQIKQCKKKLGQALLHDEQTLALFCNDFGKLAHSEPVAIFEPQETESIQLLIHYAYENQLPITLRGNGMSQSGQSLAVPGGLIINMKHFDSLSELEPHSIWVEANTSWSALLDKSLQQLLVPYIVPHNCNLSVGGVISAGGIGSSSFKYGSATAHVNALNIVQANGELTHVDAQSALMQACLGGQGRFGLITQACVALRPCSKSVRTFFLVYLDKETWLNDLVLCKARADYLESFCTPAIQGAKLSAKGRQPFAQWLYAIHVSLEYNDCAPDVSHFGLNPWRLVHTQDESIHSYLHRHDSRFNAMKMTGQWELHHPWYECFISGSQLEHLDEILETLPIHYASVVHIVSIAAVSSPGFLQLPKSNDIFALMILNPGVPKVFIPSCLETIKYLDSIFLPNGGKRYLSGYLGESPKKEFWQNHFEAQYEDWMCLKKRYDPRHIFCSLLHRY